MNPRNFCKKKLYTDVQTGVPPIPHHISSMLFQTSQRNACQMDLVKGTIEMKMKMKMRKTRY